VKKLNEYNKKEKQRITSEIEAHATIFEIDEYDSTTSGDVIIDLGLCSKCKDLLCTQTEYGTIYAQCRIWEKMLNTSNRVKHCTRFRRRGQMSLYDMQDIATIININKREIGFKNEKKL